MRRQRIRHAFRRPCRQRHFSPLIRFDYAAAAATFTMFASRLMLLMIRRALTPMLMPVTAVVMLMLRAALCLSGATSERAIQALHTSRYLYVLPPASFATPPDYARHCQHYYATPLPR